MGFGEELPSAFERGPGYVVSTWRNALLMMWTGAITTQALEVTLRAGKMLDRRHPGGQVAVSVSLPNVPIPDDTVRKRAAELMRERADMVRVSVNVLEGDGFWISAGRMVMTALITLSGTKSKPIITKSMEEAATAIQPHVAPTANLAEITRALRAFRG